MLQLVCLPPMLSKKEQGSGPLEKHVFWDDASDELVWKPQPVLPLARQMLVSDSAVRLTRSLRLEPELIFA